MECPNAPPQKCATIGSDLHALRRTIEEAHTYRMLDLGNGFRHRRLRNRKEFGGFPHAAGFGHRHEDVQIVQLQATADTIIPPHDKHFDERDEVINIRLWGALQYRITKPLYGN